MPKKVKKVKKVAKLTGYAAKLAKDFIAEEVRTGKYSRAQAIAIGISRARAVVAPPKRRRSRISAILDRYPGEEELTGHRERVDRYPGED